MNSRDESAPFSGAAPTGLFFSLIDGQVCACWHGRDEIVRLAPLIEAQVAMLDFQIQTKVGERLSNSHRDKVPD